mmetsp:Transcript_14960/g.36622  ORF Transcript_14960/g.36622 Transcript_14960/m.36622 type:complete len:240 (-) Transcript_14960:82-801(-)
MICGPLLPPSATAAPPRAATAAAPPPMTPIGTSTPSEFSRALRTGAAGAPSSSSAGFLLPNSGFAGAASGAEEAVPFEPEAAESYDSAPKSPKSSSSALALPAIIAEARPAMAARFDTAAAASGKGEAPAGSSAWPRACMAAFRLLSTAEENGARWRIVLATGLGRACRLARAFGAARATRTIRVAEAEASILVPAMISRCGVCRSGSSRRWRALSNESNESNGRRGGATAMGEEEGQR